MLKRKDDIRRRLTISEVPKPPVDLVQKIKRDIPKHYTSKTTKQAEVRQKRESLPIWQFWGASWGLAAGILVLIGLTWAVFEAYEAEHGAATKVAEAAPYADSVALKSVEAQESIDQKKESGAYRELESTADERDVSGGKRQESQLREQRVDQIPAARPSAPPAADAYAFAPEPAAEASGRLARDSDVAATAPQPVAQASEETVALADAPARGLEDREAGGESGTAGGLTTGVIGGVVGATIAEAPAETAADKAMAKTAEAKRSKDDATINVAEAVTISASAPAAIHDEIKPLWAREVVVKELAVEAIVETDLDLDEWGKVTRLHVRDTKDKAIIEAVTEASKEWIFPIAVDEHGNKQLKMTIGVRLRRAD